MDLWIRSQDKCNLAKIINIEVERTTIKGKCDEWYVQLGYYKTKERALEVLNEIHQRLIDLQTLEYLQGTMNLDWKHNRSIDCVYEMPKD